MFTNNSDKLAFEQIIKMIPCEDEFWRMMELSPKRMERIVDRKPVLEYSQADIINMSKEEYKEKFLKWSSDSADWQLSAYEKFVEWNRNCILEMGEDDRKHLAWFCRRILKWEVINLDMEACCEFGTVGIYFNSLKQLVVYNGR